MTEQASRVATLEALRRHRTLEFSVGAGDWPFRGLLVQVGETVRAYANVCPHQGHPLNLQEHRFLAADGQHLICLSHGALFDPASGVCVRGPCAGAGLQALPVEIRGPDIFVTAPDTRR